ncbi:hypothetical protein ACP4OV_015062 [Aristida adscensionis]
MSSSSSWPASAGVKRRPSGGSLWLAYQLPDWAALRALGNPALGSTPREQRLVVLWVPFLLMHLGAAENITAYSLEDTKLSKRQVLKTVLQVLGTPAAIYKQYMAGAGDDRPLLWASILMVAVGVKYWEKAMALRGGEFGKMRTSRTRDPKGLRIQPPARRKKMLDDEQALLVAHELLHVTKGAFADYSVEEHPLQDDPNLKQIFSNLPESPHGFENMWKVVEMELSLMYDILYTKAAVAHSWVGYVIRVASPITTAMVTMLFCFHFRKDDQRVADVVITYVLLLVTFLIDVRWLLRAIASTWTYAFLRSMKGECWIQHKVLRTGRWQRLRHAIIMSLDLRRWLFPARARGQGGSYRLWSGSVGQYNLFHECTCDTVTPFSKMVKMVVPEDIWVEYNYSKGLQLRSSISQEIKGYLFQYISGELNFWAPLPPHEKEMAEEKKKKAEEEKRKKRDDDDQKRRRGLDESLGFLPELQELILIWHVATDIFILHNQQQAKIKQQYKAIKPVSDYMAFLVAARPDMIPGLKLRSLYDVTREALDDIWKDKANGSWESTKHKPREQKLASILLRMENDKRSGALSQDNKCELHKENLLLSDGTKFAQVLQQWLIPENDQDWYRSEYQDWDRIREKFGIGEKSGKKFLFVIPEMQEWRGFFTMEYLLNVILKSWVRMLIYASTRCSRDTHAKQLSRGCELTTIVWILSDHAGIFGYEGRKRNRR